MTDGLLYCMLYVQWPLRKYFGPRAPQRLNRAQFTRRQCWWPNRHQATARIAYSQQN